MPEVSPLTMRTIMLYQRCRRYRCLPGPGGLVDQSAALMAMFDVVAATIARAERDRSDRQRRAAAAAQLETELRREWRAKT